MSVISSYAEFKDYETVNFSFYQRVLHNPIYHTYAVFTGTNTGYGFYGINVATYKFFTVEVYDENKNLIHKTKSFDFKNKNNLDRFDVLASKMSLYISDNKEFPENGNQRLLELRKLYVNKMFKHIGLFEAKKHQHSTSYKTTLYTMMPEDIWSSPTYNTSKKLGIYESLEFAIK